MCSGAGAAGSELGSAHALGDAVMDMVHQYPTTTHGCKLLTEKFVDMEPDGSWKWRESERNCIGKFDEEKELCRRHALWRYADRIAVQPSCAVFLQISPFSPNTGKKPAHPTQQVEKGGTA